MLSLEGQALKLEDVLAVAGGTVRVKLGADARERMIESRHVIEKIVAGDALVYGVNTGFGKLSDVHVPAAQLQELQHNLVRSHACGVGPPLSEIEVRAMMVLRANVLALGFSGCRPEVVETLLGMIERGITPVVPERGSVGASGDLAPLAHLALAAIGEGEVLFQHKKVLTDEAFRFSGLAPLHLEAKEGLALLNGTQAMCAVGGVALYRAERLCRVADVAGAMAVEALKGTPVAFDERIQRVRPHPGQAAVAAHLRSLLADSEIRKSHEVNDPRVQDAYSLRCIPQVHGAVRTALDHARKIIEIESASATDNPLVFAETGDVLSGGNFHGAPIAHVLDYAAIALTDLGSMSERRIDHMVNPNLNEGLPAFLTIHAGMESGFMIPHVSAAALLNECKCLAHPASVDNVPTSGGKEDHVSMGMTSALKLRSIVTHLETILAIELLTAAQALEFRKPLRPGRGVLHAYEIIRSLSRAVAKDRSMSQDIERIALAIRRGDLNPVETA